MQDDFPLRMRQRLPGPSFEKLLRINEQFTIELCEALRATKRSVVLELDLLFKTATRKVRLSAQYGTLAHPRPYSFDATVAPPLSAKTVQRRLKVWSFSRIHPAFARCITIIRLRVPATSLVGSNYYTGAVEARFREFIAPLKTFLSTTSLSLVDKMPNIRTFEVAFSDFWFPLTLTGNASYRPASRVRCLDLLWQPSARYVGGQPWPIFFIGRARLQEWLENVSKEATDLAWVIGCLNYGLGDYVKLHPGIQDELPERVNVTTPPFERPFQMIPRRVFVGPAYINANYQ